ncbi:MAG: hypothetical protein HON04_10520 [Planctomicrobium sp.]|jgi:hypothetical protein|nr:hypothetical protein [Planctomicrobium sp.]
MVQTLEQVVESDPPEVTSSTPQIQREFYDADTFSYRTVPVIAVVGLVISLLSAMSIFIWIALPLCAIGLIVSTLSFFVIRRNRDIYSGTMVALSGMLLSASFLISGVSYQVYTYQTEVPEGYERISFVNDISDKGIITQNGYQTIHPDIAKLDGKKIFLKGYIYQTGKLRDLESFLLVKDNQSCCFGATPAIIDRMGVVMDPDKAIDYKAGKVGVAGTFRLNKEFTNDELEPLFMLDSMYFTSRVSDFEAR